MNTLLIKSLSLAVGTSAAIGGGIWAWSNEIFSNSKNIKNKLISEKYQILTRTSDSWSSIFSKYSDTGNKDWKFDGEIKNVEDLKNTCEKVIKEKEENSSLYKKASKWCVVPRKAEEFVSGLLDVAEGKDGESWKRVLAEYKKTKTGSSSTYEMSDVTVTESNSDQDADNIKKLQAGCTTRKGKLTYELDFDSSLDDMRKWCVDRK
ncbi:hypothetical protein HF1_13100 [Mycoplasma haemofelis str. Langford 1]|uniref:Uncharacterized protein n=1 Tax=Mycoplasma haemofelis (strain Langford 1) TaxID=941640 RepID=E8ZJJ7_MYCHL|nr:hypothetical protein [Mycoplasma haemofelis]CBY93318.1 hypothetical protein HF1_13100 [Mycoplasma haemofelis str. Langford 1]